MFVVVLEQLCYRGPLAATFSMGLKQDWTEDCGAGTNHVNKHKITNRQSILL
jgi:hypothetical protein